MPNSNQRHPALCVGVSCLVAAAFPTASRADDAVSSSDCSAVYETAQAQEQDGHLRDASVLFENCALDSCQNPVRALCQAKLFRLELDAPSVVPLVRDASGAAIVDAQVTIDGVALASRLDGRAFRVDPGFHAFEFSVDGSSVGTQQLVIAQGQRNRELWMTLPSPTPASNEPALQSTASVDEGSVASQADPRAEPSRAARTAIVQQTAAPRVALTLEHEPSHGPALAPYFFGGGALLGVGAYALLSNWARSDNQKLSQCAPYCAPESIAHIHSLYTAANISLGVAAAAAAVGVTWFIVDRSHSHSSDTSAAPSGLALTLQPERNGALATVRGSL